MKSARITAADRKKLWRQLLPQLETDIKDEGEPSLALTVRLMRLLRDCVNADGPKLTTDIPIYLRVCELWRSDSSPVAELWQKTKDLFHLSEMGELTAEALAKFMARFDITHSTLAAKLPNRSSLPERHGGYGTIERDDDDREPGEMSPDGRFQLDVKVELVRLGREDLLI